MSAKRLLVTGANGFIGRHVVTRLLDDGHSLTLGESASYPSGWRENPRIRIVALKRLECDQKLDHALQDVGKVIHLAGLAHIARSDRDDADEEFHKANAVATANLVAAAEGAQIDSFINLSSLAAIVDNSVAYTITDDTQGEPTTAYGRSKLEAEKHVGRLARSGILAVSLRPPLVVGAAAKGNWAGLQKLAASGIPLPFASIRNARSFISAHSLAEAVSHLCRSTWPKELSGRYCLADPGFLSLRDVVEELRAGMGMGARLLPCPATVFGWLGAATGRRRQMAGLTGDLKVDPSRFIERFRFSPSLPIREAIRRSGEEYGRQVRGGNI